MNDDDVSKSWNDPTALRTGGAYLATVMAAGLVAVMLYNKTGWPIWGFGAPAIFFLGGLGALAQTYRVWKRGGTWPIWQGLGWLLLMTMLVALGVPDIS